ncbi:MAG TPA: hypothetical protein VFE55_15540 [Acidimicrobiia bacterium]|nr:hypothetical protein [Acidimicrobiia bacterium]
MHGIPIEVRGPDARPYVTDEPHWRREPQAATSETPSRRGPPTRRNCVVCGAEVLFRGARRPDPITCARRVSRCYYEALAAKAGAQLHDDDAEAPDFLPDPAERADAADTAKPEEQVEPEHSVREHEAVEPEMLVIVPKLSELARSLGLVA